MTITEILEQAQTLSPQERKELVKLLVDSLEVAKPASNIPAEHWGKNLLRLLDEIGPIELIYPEIDDPVAWVKHIRQEQALLRGLEWEQDE